MKEEVYSLPSAADSSLAVRTGFIRRTYLHAAGAIAAFALLEVLIFKSGLDLQSQDVVWKSIFLADRSRTFHGGKLRCG